MARIKEYRAARDAVDHAVGTLLSRASHYQGPPEGGGTTDLLKAAREYSRAINRLEHVRRR